MKKEDRRNWLFDMLDEVQIWEEDAANIVNPIEKEFEQLEHQVKVLKEDLWLSPSQICKKYQCQCCHICEEVGCGDNTSKAKEKIEQLEHQVRVLKTENDKWRNAYKNIELGEALKEAK